MKKVIYICSAGHSGSTLLDLLLGGHTNVTSLGEISHLPKNLALNTVCTCGEKVRSCKLWSRVIADMEEYLDASLVDDPYKMNLGFFSARVVIDKKHQTGLYLLGKKIILGLWNLSLRYGVYLPSCIFKKIDEGAKNSFYLYDLVCKYMGTDFIVDSSKNYSKAVSLYKENPDKVKIILLSRDGRGVFYSGIKRNHSMEESLSSWYRYYQRAIPLIEKVVDENDVLRIHYEDLASNPSGEIKKIFNFAGIKYEEITPGVNNKVYHITNGNNMRFDFNGIKLDTRWKDELTGNELRYFDKKAGRLNRALGYTG